MLARSTSFESIQVNQGERTPSNVEPEEKRQTKMRSRACNESFRQAVDKSYEQNMTPEG